MIVTWKIKLRRVKSSLIFVTNTRDNFLLNFYPYGSYPLFKILYTSIRIHLFINKESKKHFLIFKFLIWQDI